MSTKEVFWSFAPSFGCFLPWNAIGRFVLHITGGVVVLRSACTCWPPFSPRGKSFFIYDQHKEVSVGLVPYGKEDRPQNRPQSCEIRAQRSSASLRKKNYRHVPHLLRRAPGLCCTATAMPECWHHMSSCFSSELCAQISSGWPNGGCTIKFQTHRRGKL